ncbi:hypothetical protein B808_311 [Fructilactobacillus florum 8D]|uniref:Uncharacterized protein n=1 Tax=Fructilactobacillus florum 8D TaxID=1221538 RepID=W9EI99_9LACO|nr:hypothetical protein B808_311 [Fructilactobacillus florum 8D]
MIQPVVSEALSKNLFIFHPTSCYLNSAHKQLFNLVVVKGTSDCSSNCRIPAMITANLCNDLTLKFGSISKDLLDYQGVDLSAVEASNRYFRVKIVVNDYGFQGFINRAS